MNLRLRRRFLFVTTVNRTRLTWQFPGARVSIVPARSALRICPLSVSHLYAIVKGSTSHFYMILYFAQMRGVCFVYL